MLKIVRTVYFVHQVYIFYGTFFINDRVKPCKMAVFVRKITAEKLCTLDPAKGVCSDKQINQTTSSDFQTSLFFCAGLQISNSKFYIEVTFS